MKMITAIINKKDSSYVCESLRDEKIAFTKMASTGGFLRSGNVTLLIGVDDDMVDKTIEVIRTHCAQRMEPAPAMTDMSVSNGINLQGQLKVPVGGATVFVSNVELYEKM